MRITSKDFARPSLGFILDCSRSSVSKAERDSNDQYRQWKIEGGLGRVS